MISTRHLPLICLLLAAALVPTVIHSYAGATVDDGRQSTSIGLALGGYTGKPTSRDRGWGTRRFASTDWLERLYSTRDDEVQLTVIRSFDHKKLYHHPELDVAYGTGFLSQETIRLSSRPEIPVHVLRTGTDAGSVAMYVLHYNESYIDNPLWFQVQVAGEMLFGGRKPMTLFFARDLHAVRNANPESLGAGRVLLAAIDQFVARPREE